MKERDQLLLILKYQENLREKEIASILHIPRGTVSSRIITLLKRIKAELLEEESDNG
jgi:RNA polymerase sigma-70 factor (ECF subfamily)